MLSVLGAWARDTRVRGYPYMAVPIDCTGVRRERAGNAMGGLGVCKGRCVKCAEVCEGSKSDLLGFVRVLARGHARIAEIRKLCYSSKQRRLAESGREE